MDTKSPRFADIGIQRLNKEGDLLLTLSGPVAHELRSSIHEVLAAYNGTKNLVVDLTAARYADPYALGPIVVAMQKARSHGKKVAIIRANKRVKESLRSLDLKGGLFFWCLRLESVAELGITLS